MRESDEMGPFVKGGYVLWRGVVEGEAKKWGLDRESTEGEIEMDKVGV